MEKLMLEHPDDWQGHYHGDEAALRLQRHYSYSDRIRYYWNRPEAATAVDALSKALEGRRIPEPLLRQYLPQYGLTDVSGMQDILIAAVDEVLGVYDRAARPDAV